MGTSPIDRLSEKVFSPAAPSSAGGGTQRFSNLKGLNWALLIYAALTILAVSAYVVSRVHADYEQTLTAERNRLRGVSAALQAGTLAMLNDGVGAAVAGANELQSAGRLILASREVIVGTLRKQLAGGGYVRFLFLSDGEHFALTSRRHSFGSSATPAWLTVSGTPLSNDTWVGSPIEDPERSGELLIPIARRVTWGKDSALWAGALFSFDAFDDLYHQFSGQVVTIGLLTIDGIVLVRAPKLGGRDISAGESVASTDIFRSVLDQGNAGIVEGYGRVIKKAVIYAFDRVNGYPLYVTAGQSRDEVLAPWRDRRQVSIAGAVAVCALLLVMTTLLNHYVLKLRGRERDYRALFNNAQFSAFLLEGDRFVDANSTAVRMFGLESQNSAAGLTPWQLSPEYQPDGQRSDELARTRIETALREGGTTFEWLHKRIDTGASFPAEVDLSTLSSGNTVLALAVVHDVTVRKRAEQDLRTLSAELMRSQDEERRRIGRDLHDSTGQILAALELGLAQLMQGVNSTTAQQRDLLEHCADLANQCSTELRTASYLLHPPLLDELGLLSALRWLADGFRQRTAIEVRLDLPDTMERLASEHELTLFRIAQEALTNVYRHADSPWAAIRLKAQSDSVMLEIEDGGRGMAPVHEDSAESMPLLGVGLAGMRERIRQIGGTFSTESTEAGTRVRSTIPISRARAVADPT